jgi:rsbT antagonist protein RsbS
MKDRSGFVSVLRVFDVLIVPLQGQLDDADADSVTDDVLQRIRAHGCRGLVIDVSGVALLDSHLCSVVAQLARAAELMGTASFVAGMSPQIAMTLESMGVELKHATMRRGLEQALEELGIRCERRNK